MKRKTLSLVVGALALAASMAVSQAALAGHETVQSTKAMTGSVVPTYKTCVANDSGHAAPISFQSCAAGIATNDTSALITPQPYSTSGGGFTSSYSVSIVRPSNVFGAPDDTDVKVVDTSTGTLCENASLFIVAVRSTVCPSGSNAGYSGNVIGESLLNTVDGNNCPTLACPAGSGTIHATVKPFTFSFVVPCTSGNCNLTTSADAQFGSPYDATKDPTINGKRADIEIKEVVVRDPGPNGTAGTACPLSCGDGDETLAAAQGLFIK